MTKVVVAAEALNWKFLFSLSVASCCQTISVLVFGQKGIFEVSRPKHSNNVYAMVQGLNAVELAPDWLKRAKMYVEKHIWNEHSVDALTWFIFSRSGDNCILTKKKWKMNLGIDCMECERLPIRKPDSDHCYLSLTLMVWTFLFG